MPKTPTGTDDASLEEFQALWRRNLLESATDDSAGVHRHLIDAYGEPHRFYHTLTHIQRCLSLLNDVRQQLNNSDALTLAIWFHDAIYLPGAKNNERLSAQWFMALSEEIFSEDLRVTVQSLIMATWHGNNEISDHDAKFMVDIDLSSFGMPWPIFSHDSENVRRERPGMTDEAFYPKHASFIEHLLQNSRFFRSDYFYQHYEAQAQENLTRYFDATKKKLQDS